MTQIRGRVEERGEENRATARGAEHRERRRRRLIVFTVLTAVIIVDQAVKWWAWRRVGGVDVNPGGDMLIGPIVSKWYVQPVSGALLDLADFALVSVAIAALVRKRLPPVMTVCGSLMVGGWASNLLDRLGMHYWTAPGSMRGAVDFISMAGTRWNLADFAIIGATPLFLLAAAFLALRAACRHAVGPATPAGRTLRPRMFIGALGAAGLCVTVALGAVHHGRLIRPSPVRPRTCQHPRTTQILTSNGYIITQAMCPRP